MIRASLLRWQEVSQQILTVSVNTGEEQRDDTIEKISNLLDERDRLQADIAPPFTQAEDELGQSLIQLEKQVVQALERYKQTIRSSITATQSKKEHVKSYVNPYANVSRDGTFYDTKS